MFIKNLSLKNFKSFKNNTIRFERGFNAIVGPNGSGKSVRGDTKVLLSNGSVKPISEIVESGLNKASSLIELDDGVMTLENPSDLKVVGLDTATMRAVTRPVSAFIRRKGEPFLYDIRTASGKNVVATGCHPVMVFKDGTVKSDLVGNMKVGDLLATPRSLKIENKPSPVLLGQGFVLENDSDHWLVSSSTNSRYLRHPVRVPKQCDEDFARFIGYLVGDGYIAHNRCELINSDERIIKDFVSLGKKYFNTEDCYCKKTGKATRVIFFNSLFSLVLSDVYAKPVSELRSAGKTVPGFIQQSGDRVVANFLAALFDCDATVSSRTPEFQHVTKSEELADQVQTLLLRFGIHSVKKRVMKCATNTLAKTRRAYFSVSVYGKGDLSKILSHIPFKQELKRSRLLAHSLKESAANPNVDVLPMQVNYLIREAVQNLGICYKPLRSEYPRLAAYMESRCNPTNEGVRQLLPVFEEKMSQLALMQSSLMEDSDSLLASLDAMNIPHQRASESIDLNKGAIAVWMYCGFSPRPQNLHKLYLFVNNELERRMRRSSTLISQLRTICSSDIFWDKIVSIEKTSAEEWVYDLTVPGCENFVANGLFVHNSNVIDAVQFVFGENRVRALRAKKIGDLIFTNAKIGEVELELMDDSGNVVHKITRAIRNDGKTKYRLDGKTTKKYVIEDFLAANRMSSHNIIQQGQVQQIVEMSSKDRRGLIDAIANVSEYEDKKREAISKLESVQQKLREAASILAEREGYMTQLKQEKDEAEMYVRLKKELESVKATLLSLTANELQADFDAVVTAMLESSGKMENIAGEIMQLEQKITDANNGKQKVDEEIFKRSEGKQVELQKHIDELNSNITISKALIKEKNEFLNKSDEKKRVIELDVMKASDEVKGFASQISQLEDDHKSMKKMYEDEKADYDKALSDNNSFTNQFYSAKKAMDDAQNEMLATKEKLNLIQAEASMIREKQKLKMDELDRLRQGKFDDFTEKKRNLHEASKEYQRDIAALEGELNSIFKQEKELNERIPTLDALILDTKERMIELSGQMRNVREVGESTSIGAVLAMRQKEPGIFGTVDQLCKYESEFAVPIQVAFGNRMNYVVVENSQIATMAIEYLRREKLGRVSFIPLDKIHAPPITGSDRELAKHKASQGFLIEKLDFDPQLKRAFEYVCGNTIVTDNIRDSRELVGKIRFVTRDGDLGESSGLLTGGGKVAAKVNLIKVQAEYDEFSKKNVDAKSEKDSAIRSLQTIQLQMHELRRKKSELELKQKAIKMELDDCDRREQEQDERTSNLKAAIKGLEKEISKADEEAAAKDEERGVLIRRLSELNMVLLENKQKVDVEKEKNFGLILKEKERKISDLKISLSDVSNRLASLDSQRTVYEKQHKDYRKQLDEIAEERQSAKHAIDEADKLLKISREEVEKKLAEQREIAGALKGLYDKRDGLEKEVQTLGNKKGRLELEREKIQLGVHDKELKRGTLEVKLSAVQADLAAFGEAAILENAKKDDLDAKKHELEPQVVSLSTRVNMLAIDAFSKRLAEFEEQKANVAQLSKEKESVYMLITEIEGRKVATFMNAFNFVNDNFFKLFSQIFRGNGRLILENAENPFEGGLTIEVALDNKEVKYLELMSGGEKSLVALIFLFALQAYNPSSVYILDEADSALDQENSRKLALLVSELSKKSQFLLISHNQAVYKSAQCLVGITMTKEGSKVVEVKLHEKEEGITVA